MKGKKKLPIRVRLHIWWKKCYKPKVQLGAQGEWSYDDVQKGGK